MDIKEHSTAGIGHVGDKTLSLCQGIDQPAVHCAKPKPSFFRQRAGLRHMVENPLHLGTGKIGVDNQAGFLPDIGLPALGFQLFTKLRRPAALPHNGIAYRDTGFGVPGHGGFPLVGNADSGDFLHGDFRPVHGFPGGEKLAFQNLHRIVLHIARLGIDLRKLLLPLRDNFSITVEQDGPGTGGSLIQR